MDEIARSAGLAKGTLYLYYPSKQDLYHAALREGLVELCRELEREVDAAPTLARAIESYVATKVAYFAKHHDFFRLYLAEFGNALTGGANEDFRDLCFLQMDLLERTIVAKAPESAHPVDARAAAAAVFDLTRGVVYRRLLGWSDSRAEEDASHVVDFAVGALGLR